MEVSEIFKALPFSTAVCVVLFVFCFKLFQQQNRRMDENAKDAQALQDKYINYLQNANEKLIQCLNDNTQALKEFTNVLNEVKKEIQKD